VRTGVWGHRRFALFWTGDTLSALGSALSVAAVPILAYSVLHASPGELGVIKAAQTLPFLIFAIPIGEYADKLPRRRILLAADGSDRREP
jgi:MFS family permease